MKSLLTLSLHFQAAIVFNATQVDPAAVETILNDLVEATTPSVTDPISQFPRDLDTTNEVVGLTVDFLRRDLESGDPIDLSTVSKMCYQSMNSKLLIV